jgi:hypothetical protein
LVQTLSHAHYTIGAKLREEVHNCHPEGYRVKNGVEDATIHMQRMPVMLSGPKFHHCLSKTIRVVSPQKQLGIHFGTVGQLLFQLRR